MMQKRQCFAVICACAVVIQGVLSISVEAVEVDVHARQLSYLSWQQTESSSQNPDNDFLGLYRYQAHAELRPDISLVGNRYQLMLKPRFSYDYWWHKVGVPEDNESKDDAYLNEGLLQIGFTPTFFTSYGRENLQWGPTSLRTPSNPFFSDNGQDKPKKEVEGKDFLKFIYLPSDWFTVGVIGNLEQGGMRADSSVADPEFKRKYALKLDMLGVNYNASLLLSRREGGNETWGGFVQVTVSDALLAYFDAAVNRGNTALYPRLDPGHPLGGDFVRRYDSTTEERFIGIVGASYTLENSATVSLEYLYNGTGYNDTEAEAYYTLRQNAADNIHHPIFGGLAHSHLAETLNPGLILLRRNYLLLQYTFNEMGNNLSYTFRLTTNLDDDSDKVTLITEYAYNDYLQIFAVGDMSQGRSDTEFSSFLSSNLMIGFEYTF